MANTIGKREAVATKTLYAILKEIQKRGGSMPAHDIWEFVPTKVNFTDWEAAKVGKHQWERWRTTTQFCSIGYTKAGFLIKDKGVWYITPEGEDALKDGESAMMKRALEAYAKWKEGKDGAQLKKRSVDDIDDDAADEVSVNIEDLESRALDDIQQFLRAKTPYDFQDMVAALLRAMGYYTPFIAPKGKDGGIDIIAYLDPLGAKEPRIKVQVKHMPDTAISSKDIQALVGALRSGDIGLFITSGRFSSDAVSAARNSKEFIRILDGKDFIELWQTYYDKMTDDDKNMLPLKRIAFLGNNE